MVIYNANIHNGTYYSAMSLPSESKVSCKFRTFNRPKGNGAEDPTPQNFNAEASYKQAYK